MLLRANGVIAAVAAGRVFGLDTETHRLRLVALKQQALHLVLMLPAAALLSMFFIVPLIRVFTSSFDGREGLTLDHYDRALTSGIYQNMFRTTFELAGTTTIIALVVGYPIAYFLATSSGRRRALVLMAVLIPFLSSIIAQTYTWRIILGRRGLVNETLTGLEIIDEPLSLLFNRLSVIVAMVHVFLPFMVLPMYASMRTIPKGLPRLAESLGATPIKSFYRVFLPLSMPGVWAGALLVYSLSMGYFIAPNILGSPKDRGIASFMGSFGSFNAALAVLLLLSVVVVYLAFARFIGFGPLYGAGEALMRNVGSDGVRSSRHRLALGLFVGFACFFLILPNLIVVPMSVNNSTFALFPPKTFTMRWYTNYFTGDETAFDWIGATVTSLEIAGMVIAVVVPIGGLVAYALVRGQFPGKRLINFVVISPLVIPSAVLAVAVGFFYFDHLYLLLGTVPGIAFPHMVLALPYVVIIITATLRGMDEIHERAAMTLGAARWMTFRRVILPQIYPGVAVAGLFAFLVSFNEVVIAIFLKTPYLRTLPMNLWNGVTSEFAPMMGAVSTMLLMFAIVVFIAVAYLRVRMGREPKISKEARWPRPRLIQPLPTLRVR